MTGASSSAVGQTCGLQFSACTAAEHSAGGDLGRHLTRFTSTTPAEARFLKSSIDAALATCAALNGGSSPCEDLRNGAMTSRFLGTKRPVSIAETGVSPRRGRLQQVPDNAQAPSSVASIRGKLENGRKPAGNADLRACVRLWIAETCAVLWSLASSTQPDNERRTFAARSSEQPVRAVFPAVVGGSHPGKPHGREFQGQPSGKFERLLSSHRNASQSSRGSNRDHLVAN